MSKPETIQLHYDPETESCIEERWYKHKFGGWYREVSRPSGLPETKLWKRLTQGLN